MTSPIHTDAGSGTYTRSACSKLKGGKGSNFKRGSKAEMNAHLLLPSESREAKRILQRYSHHIQVRILGCKGGL